MCGCQRLTPVFVFEAPPEGEVRFDFSVAGGYHREVLRCAVCGHFISVHDMAMNGLYQEAYISSTYGDDGLRRAFERVIALDPVKSDNADRVKRIVEFAADYLTAPAVEKRPPNVLDVGSGLCVFLHRMKAAGWECTALDPAQRAAAHAREVVGVNAVCADFMDAHDLGRFDAVAFNKVLEHVEDPTEMLVKSARYLREGGFVYAEVPDGEAAVADGPGREEFFIEHHHIFSAVSFALLANRAGFCVRHLERLREPSGKYTLRSFLVRVGRTL